ncbi:MAG: TatD family hydrolase [Cytophagales bacterium]|nr:TatD family hydrolase [Cytophagales bacterium]
MKFPRLIDIHTHQLNSSDFFIENVDVRGAGKWQAPRHFFSVGIHPWSVSGEIQEETWTRLRQLAEKENCLAVGEAGLDRAKGADLELQMEVFERQVRLSEELKKPMIIHCVRAYSDILSVKKRLKARQVWIIHGFQGNVSIMTQLLKHTVFLSFGPFIFRPKVESVFMKCPLDRIFFETDDQSEYSIEDLYVAASRLRKMETEELIRTVFSTFESVFCSG